MGIDQVAFGLNHFLQLHRNSYCTRGRALDVSSGSGYHSAVRRFSAIMLLGLFSLSLIEPALFADSDSKLPACCRRDGQHHCAMPGASSAGMLIQAVCPVYPKSGAAPACSKVAAPRPVQAVVAPIASHPGGRAQTQDLGRTSFSRARQKRGPPAFIA
jgi:hypothetical protein